MVRGLLGKLATRSLSAAGKWQQQQVRRLNIHEYQGAELMGKHGINVPKGVAVSSIGEVKEAIKTVFPNEKEVVVKSQILAGGRGLGTFKSGLKGGVHIVKAEEVEDLAGQLTCFQKISDFSTRRIPRPFYQYLQHSGISSTRNLLADDVSNMEPVSSPLMPLLGDGKIKVKDGSSKPVTVTVQAIKKGIKQSPKKVNLVAKLVRGMRVEDALLQLQVTVKRAAKTVYQVIHSARANAAHNHGLDSDRLLVAEAFVGKGLYLKRVSYHAKGRSGIMVRPRCRLTVVVRETTPEEEAQIARLRVSNYKKLTRKEKQLVPHQLIETTPRWGRKRKETAAASA